MACIIEWLALVYSVVIVLSHYELVFVFVSLDIDAQLPVKEGGPSCPHPRGWF